MLTCLIAFAFSKLDYRSVEIPCNLDKDSYRAAIGSVVLTDSGLVASYWFSPGMHGESFSAKPFVWQSGKLTNLPVGKNEYGHVYGGNDQVLFGDVNIEYRDYPCKWTPDPVNGWTSPKFEVLSKDEGHARWIDMKGRVYVDCEKSVRILDQGKVTEIPTGLFDVMGVDSHGDLIGNQYNGYGEGNSHSQEQPAVWRKGKFVKIGPQQNGYGLRISAVSNSGRIAGENGGDCWMMMNSQSAAVTVAPTINKSSALFEAINDSGDIVGDWVTESDWRATLWSQGNRLDLSDAIPSVHLSSAQAINNKGQIVVSDRSRSVDRVFLLTP